MRSLNVIVLLNQDCMVEPGWLDGAVAPDCLVIRR